MKKVISSRRRSALFLMGSIAALIAAPSLHAATVSTWATPGTSGSWNSTANWDANGIPNGADSIANIALGSSAETVTTIDAATWTLNGITASSSSKTIDILGASTNTVLSLGSGGITLTAPTGGSLSLGGTWWAYASSRLTLNVTADQTWSTNGSAGKGMISINANLTGNSVITIANASTDWQPGRFEFDGGNSTGFTGSFVFKSGQINLKNSSSDNNLKSQLARLGTNTMTWGNDTTFIDGYGQPAKTILQMELSGTNNTAETFATPIQFSKTGIAARVINIQNKTGVTGASLALTGAWSGDLDNTGTVLYSGNKAAKNFSSLFLINCSTTNGDGNTESQVLVRLQTDNSSLVATNKTGGSLDNSAIYFQQGAFSVENANSLGAGNALSVAIGDNAATGFAGLLTKDGINIASKIYVQNGGKSRSNEVKLGLLGSGTTTYSGDISLTQAGYSTTEAANVRLSAQAGATAAFTGKFSNVTSYQVSGFTTVTAEGGGNIILSGAQNATGDSALRSEFNIVGNTTLQADGGSSTSSATGAGNVKVGAAAASITGDTTSNSWTIANISSTAGLVVGQKITGISGIPDGSTITYIGSNYIEISNRATATTTGVSLSATAETGVLSGTGYLKPGTVNSVAQSISVAAGSTINPGVNGVGTLTLDGASTTANLLTASQGANFSYTLAAGGNSNHLNFVNYAAGDLTLSGTGAAINLTGANAGVYTLMSFYSDNGTTLTSGGVAGSGTFAINNVSGYHAKLDTSTTGKILLDNYQIASANTQPATVNLGVTHVGQNFTSSALTVQNTGTNNGYAEGLNATAGGTSGAATLAGSVTNLAGGSTSTAITVGLSDTATAGAKTGTATVGFASNGSTTSGYGTTSLDSQTVTVNGQVNYYADPTLSAVSGGDLTSTNATHYTLSLGSYNANTGEYTATISLNNFLHDATYQDLLSGTFDTTGKGLFTLVGFDGTLEAIVSGTNVTLTVSFDTTSVAKGDYEGTILFNPTSANASGTSSLNAVSLGLEFTVVPEPSTWAMIVGGMGMLAFGQRLRRRMCR